MKNFFPLITFLFLLQACGSKQSCGDNCRKKETVSLSSNGKMVISDTSQGFSCKLTTAELEKRKTDVLSVIKSKVLDKKELSNGYSFKFENTDEMIDMLTDFIKSERQCCDFFNFSIHVNNDGNLWFDLTGPKDAKEIISSELAL
jgi:hypothetical protein